MYNNIKLYKKIIKILINLFIFIQFWKIKAYWYEEREIKNFGDMLNSFLIKKITNKQPKRVDKNYWGKHYMICGSIIKNINSNTVVWGAGIKFKNEKIKKPKKTFSVRGPITRKRFLELGYDCPKNYGDPSLLLPIFYKTKINKIYKFGIIPHYVDYLKINKITEKDKNILIINLLDDVEEVIKKINQCENIISSSLHGLIVPHAYGIPAIWVEFSNNLSGDGVKFYDYFYSVNTNPYSPINLKNIKFLNYKEIQKIFEKNKKIINLPKKRKIEQIQNNLIKSCPLKIKNKDIFISNIIK
jgi:pyruvyltransferase